VREETVAVHNHLAYRDFLGVVRGIQGDGDSAFYAEGANWRTGASRPFAK
jgi:hypothetical protein